MKLLKFINEEKELYDVLEKGGVKQEFFDLFEELRCFSRYVNISKAPENIQKYTVRKDRRPKDTNIYFHSFIDDWLYRKFKWKPRSEGVFTYAEEGNTIKYAENVFFPIGNYKCVFSPNISDLFAELDTQKIDLFSTPVIIFNQIKSKEDLDQALKQKMISLEEYDDTMKRFGDLLNDYIEVTNVKELFRKKSTYLRCEVMFKCDSYYLLRGSLIKNLYKEITGDLPPWR